MVLGIAALVLVFWDRPTGKVIIVLALCVLVVLAIIEFLGRPPSPVVEVPRPETADAGGAWCRRVQRRGGPPVSSTSATLRLILSDAIAVDPQRSPLKSDA